MTRTTEAHIVIAQDTHARHPRPATWAWLALALLLATSASAQTGAAITGTVTDDQGLPLPGVTVVVRNADSGVVRDSVTEADGSYRVPGLPPGRYGITAELQGFAAIDIAPRTLTIGLEIRQDLKMSVQGLSETITVSGQAPVIQTTRSEVAQVVTQEQIQSLPVNTRQTLTLALLLPGTSQDGTRPRKVNATVGAGGTHFASAFLVDGVSNQQTSAGEPRQDFPQGAIREFKVNVSQAPAEFGGTTGGVVTIVTKSGTNLFSGEAFEFFRDKSLNAMNVFEQAAQRANGTPKPEFRRHQYGASFGGPIVKDKAHFMLAVDNTETTQAITVNTGRPQFYSSVEGNFNNPSYRRMFFSRVDTQINRQQNLFVRWAWENDHSNCETCGGNASAFSGSRIDQRRHSLVAGHSWVIGNKMLNEFRFQYAPFSFLTSPPGSDVWNDPTTFPAERFANTTFVYQFPSLTWGSGTSRVQKEWWKEFREDFSISTSAHSLKMGVASVRGPNKDDSASNTLGTWQFGTDQFFDPTNPASIARLANPILFTATLPPVYRDTKNSWFQTYVQDEWRMADNLTINLGLRYDVQYDSWNQNLDLSIFPKPLPFINPSTRGDTNNYSPRAGFAWDVTGDGGTVVRGGYGLYYRYIWGSFGSEQSNLLQNAIRIANPSYPDPYGGRSPLSFASTAPPNINITDDDIENPKAHASNVGLSQQISENIALHVDAVYTLTSKDTLTANINTPNPATRLRPLPEWGRIIESQAVGESKYRALMVRLDKRFAKRYMYLLSYTLSKTDGNNGGITSVYNPGLDYGPGDTDRRHALVASGSVMLPFDVQFGGVWTLRSTMPFSALAGRDLDGDGAANDFVPGTTSNQGNRTLDLRAVNAYRATNGLRPVSADQFDTNDYNSIDLRASKAFPMGTRRLELIAQVFNVMGRTNLLPPGAGTFVENALSDSFGRVLSALPRQQAELAVRFAW